MTCWRFCFGNPRVEPEGWGSTQQCECVCEEWKRGAHQITGVNSCEGILVLPVKVLGGVYVTPGNGCECSGSGFYLNSPRWPVEIFHTRDVLLSLWMGVGRVAGVVFLLFSFMWVRILSCTVVRTFQEFHKVSIFIFHDRCSGTGCISVVGLW